MRLSMWILYDYLESYHPVAHIQSGKQELRGVRILSDARPLGGTNVYLTRAEQYIDRNPNQVICVHGHDMILLETENIDEVFNVILDCFDFYNTWSDTFRETIRRGEDLKALLDLSKDVFHENITVTDAGHQVLCSLRASPPANMSADQQNIQALYEKMIHDGNMGLENIVWARKQRRIFSPNNKAYCASFPDSNIQILLCNIIHNGTVWGYLSESFIGSPLSIGRTQLLETLCILIEESLDSEQKQKQMLDDFSQLFCGALVADAQTEQSQFERQLQILGWLPQCRKQLLQIVCVTGDVGILPTLCSRINSINGVVSVIWNQGLLALVNLDMITNSDRSNQLPDLIRSADCYAGSSFSFTQISALCEQQKLSETALRYGSKKAGSINSCSEHILTYLTHLIKAHSSVPYTHPAVLQLMEFDRENDTQLAKTLFAFLQNDRNFALTAKILFVHRNTVQYRIEKCISLTDLDLDDPKTKFHLLLSFYIINEMGNNV